MSIKKFIEDKLKLIKKDKQSVFSDMVDTLAKQIEDAPEASTFEIPIDGNWFRLSFTALEVKKDRLVIDAERIKNGFFGDQYIVEFKGTRAAYLRGYYESCHRVGRWPYIHWDIRSYINCPLDKDKRVYIRGFHAHDELRTMIRRMEQRFSTKNIINKHINDNLLRIRMGVNQGKTPSEVERNWSKGMMESLGYKYVEVLETGSEKGSWHGASVHWFKIERDKLL